jgi:hypothetical protein
MAMTKTEPQRRTFLFVFSSMRGPAQGQLFFDDPPTPSMLKPMAAVLYGYELTGEADLARRPLAEIMEWYATGSTLGLLPASNLAKRAAEKKEP